MKTIDIKNKKLSELQNLLSEKLEIKRVCVFKLKTDEKNTKLYKNTRKDIARIKTILKTL